MAKFNKSAKTNFKTVNHESYPAYKMEPKQELYILSATCLFGEPKFYEDNSPEIIEKARKMIDKDPAFVAKLAVYCRKYFYLRTLPVALLVELANNTKGKPLVRKIAKDVISRADQMGEAMAYQLETFGRPIPNCLKKGISDALADFDEYELAKYDRDAKVKMRDIVILCHPKPEDNTRAELYKRILERELTTPETWEVEISTKGSTKESWEKIVPKMGIFAVVRNLRNFLKKEVDPKLFLKKLRDQEEIYNSKLFPFRFLSAYNEVKEVGNANTQEVLDTLEDAIETSTEALPKLPGYTFMSADHSGSMSSSISEHSKMKARDIADTMMAMSNKICNKSTCSIFGDDFKVVSLTKRNILGNTAYLGNVEVGCSTNGWKVLDYLVEKKLVTDRVILFTDEQLWDSEPSWSTGMFDKDHRITVLWNKYKKISPKAKLYLMNLVGYNTTIMPPNSVDVCQLGGWSDRILEFISIFEKDKAKAIQNIESISI